MDGNMDIVATALGAARPVAISDHKARDVAFHAFPCTRFGSPLSLAEFKETDGESCLAFYAATIGRFRGPTPTAMVFGIVAGHDEALIYDRFGLAARLTSGKPVVIRKKIRVVASLDRIKELLSDSLNVVLDPISGKVVTCPACVTHPVGIRSFLDGWERSGSSYLRMILCEKCKAMVSGREWQGSVLCANCGSRVKEDADTCKLCGEYPFSANPLQDFPY